MKKLYTILFGCLLCANVFAVPVRVVRIIDGDTFVADVLLDNDIKIKTVSVRLRNVDTPELHGKCEDEIKQAKYAKQRLGELLPENSIIEIDHIKNDKYQGRIDANVYDFANRDVGLVLVEEQVGRPYSGGKRQSWCD